MEKATVVIANDHDVMCRMIADGVMASGQFLVVAQAHNGREACEFVRTYQPDFLLLDMIMPNMDGLSVLECLRTDKHISKKPFSIVISAVSRDWVIREAFARGASYYFIKPFRMESLLERMNEILHVQEKGVHKLQMVFGEDGGIRLRREIMQEISDVFHELGIPAHLQGHQYLRDAVALSLMNMGVGRPPVKPLYEKIAAKYGVTVSRIERSMRHALEVGWNRGSIDAIHGLFGYTVACERGRPTNSEFIAQVADKLWVEMM